ncbi:hypothetical protein HMN09_01017800 [Mycena chlorophos]|uniref:DUF6699 domain-containing protein n=1 Tax=Mycena chlorophos TaxID=658473 RepID=A0A8H6W3J0_MYCCL|nr:hypothetical protein HMN09_01017800 [Mycena chlorophos]
MSGPFQYIPPAEFFAPPAVGYAWSQPRETVYPSSPFIPPLDNSPGTSNTPVSGINGDFAWPTAPHPRRRRASWHGAAPPVVPFIPPTPTTPFAEVPWMRNDAPPVIPACLPPPGFPAVPSAPSYTQYPPAPMPSYPPAAPMGYVPSIPPYSPTLQIHPWLNGETHNDLNFNLALTNFVPHRVAPDQQLIPLGAHDIQQPAFWPAVSHSLRIVCDAIPHWPIDVVYHGPQLPAPPITVGDILVEAHKHMHKSISHADWEQLSHEQEAEVSRTFTRRCRMDADLRRAAGLPDYHLIPARKAGVKIVDFLGGRSMFRGLVRAEDGTVRLIVSE